MTESLEGKLHWGRSVAVARRTRRIAGTMTRFSIGMGLSAVEGTVSPLTYFWDLKNSSHGKLERVLAITPLVPPTLAALVSGLITHDGGAMLISTGGVYLFEGTAYSALVRFISPPDNSN